MNIDQASPQELLQFLRNYDVAALATVENGNVRATTIYYFADDDLKFYFLTKNETKKFSELVKDTRVGLVITDPQLLQTVQIEGVAKEVDYTKEFAGVKEKYINYLESRGKEWENLPINHMLSTGYYVFVQVIPTWIRWTDFKNWSHTIKFEQHYSYS